MPGFGRDDLTYFGTFPLTLRINTVTPTTAGVTVLATMQATGGAIMGLNHRRLDLQPASGQSVKHV